MISTLLFEAVDFAYTVGRVIVRITGDIISFYSPPKKRIDDLERQIKLLELERAKLILS